MKATESHRIQKYDSERNYFGFWFIEKKLSVGKKANLIFFDIFLNFKQFILKHHRIDFYASLGERKMIVYNGCKSSKFEFLMIIFSITLFTKK